MNIAFKLSSCASVPYFGCQNPKCKNKVGQLFFSGSNCSDVSCFISTFKAVLSLLLSPLSYPPSDSTFRLLGGKVLFSPSSTVLGCQYNGFIFLSAGCNSRIQSSSQVLRYSWLASGPTVQASGITNIIAMGSNDAIKGTAVQILDPSFTPVPAVPYFGCQNPKRRKWLRLAFFSASFSTDSSRFVSAFKAVCTLSSSQLLFPPSDSTFCFAQQ